MKDHIFKEVKAIKKELFRDIKGSCCIFIINIKKTKDMKKIKTIKLHDLSHVEIENKEMNCLRGGYRTWCIAICLDSICKCAEDEYGGFSTSQSITETYDSTQITEESTIEYASRETPGYFGEEERYT